MRTNKCTSNIGLWGPLPQSARKCDLCFHRGGGGSRSLTRHAERRRDLYEGNCRDDSFRMVILTPAICAFRHVRFQKILNLSAAMVSSAGGR